jgi:hypothetical protein
MLLEGPLRWPGVAIETPSLHFLKKMDKAFCIAGNASGGHRNPYPNQYNDNATGWLTKPLLSYKNIIGLPLFF